MNKIIIIIIITRQLVGRRSMSIKSLQGRRHFDFVLNIHKLQKRTITYKTNIKSLTKKYSIRQNAYNIFN